MEDKSISEIFPQGQCLISISKRILARQFKTIEKSIFLTLVTLLVNTSITKHTFYLVYLSLAGTFSMHHTTVDGCIHVNWVI